MTCVKVYTIYSIYRLYLDLSCQRRGLGRRSLPKITVRAPERGRQRRPRSGARTKRFFWRANGPPNLLNTAESIDFTGAADVNDQKVTGQLY